MTNTKYTAHQISEFAAPHLGTLMAYDDAETQFRVEFPVSTRAAGFFDEMVSRYLSDEPVTYDDPAMCVVIINQ
jgi:hypothetical protein